MPGTWYTSDPHLHHKLMVTTRGFASLDEHDGEIIRRWNKMVSPEDTVWVLGDIGMGNEAAHLGLAACLNGTKHLISGNLDILHRPKGRGFPESPLGFPVSLATARPGFPVWV